MNIVKKVLYLLGTVMVISGCATATREQPQSWSHSVSGLSVKTKLTVGEHYRSYRCMVYSTVTNERSSNIRGGYLKFTFYDEKGTFESSATVLLTSGLPAGQTVTYENSLNDNTGGKYYPYSCPKLQKLSIDTTLY